MCDGVTSLGGDWPYQNQGENWGKINKVSAGVVKGVCRSRKAWSKGSPEAGGIGQGCLWNRMVWSRVCAEAGKNFSSVSVQRSGILQECLQEQVGLEKNICRSG